MKKWLYILFLTPFISCTDYPDPEVKPLEAYTFFPINNFQVSTADSILKDSVGLIISDYINPFENNFYINFEVIDGAGEVSSSTINPVYGYATTWWKLGQGSHEQHLLAKIFDNNDQFIHEVVLTAYGFREDFWDKVSDAPFTGFTRMIIDTSTNSTFALSGFKMYKRNEPYYVWDLIPTIDGSLNPYNLIIDSKGYLYISNWNGDLFCSEDKGLTWEKKTSPEPGIEGYNQLRITSDDILWAASFSYPIRYSKDGGETWTVDTIGLSGDKTLQDIYKFSNGEYIMLSSPTSLYTFNMENKIWDRLTAPGYPDKLYVTENDEVILLNQANGISILKSTDYGETFTLKHSVMPEYGTSMQNTICKVQDEYYILIPGYGILTTQDFEDFQIFFENPKIDKIFVDHDGIFYVTNNNSNDPAYILKRSN